MNTPLSAQQLVLRLLESRAALDPEDQASQDQFARFAREHPDCCERTLRAGHFTGSAWLVSADGRRVLLTHHRKLGRWLQLGGHADGDGDLPAVALREAEEESGLTGLSVERQPLDMDLHYIPEHGDDAGHWHYDVRFVVQASGSEDFVASEESHALAWRQIENLVFDPTADQSLRRMAAKWLARQ